MSHVARIWGVHALGCVTAIAVGAATMYALMLAIPKSPDWPSGVGIAILALFAMALAGFVAYFAVITRLLGLRPGPLGWGIAVFLALAAIAFWFWGVVQGIASPLEAGVMAAGLVFVGGGLTLVRVVGAGP